WRRRELHHGFALFSHFLSLLTALIGFTIERLRHACRPTKFAEGKNLNLKIAAFGFDPQHVPDFYFPRRLHELVVRFNSAEFAGFGRQRTGLKESCRPKQFVDSNTGHLFYSAVSPD